MAWDLRDGEFNGLPHLSYGNTCISNILNFINCPKFDPVTKLSKVTNFEILVCQPPMLCWPYNLLCYSLLRGLVCGRLYK